MHVYKNNASLSETVKRYSGKEDRDTDRNNELVYIYVTRATFPSN